jgi:hypothetical protein
MAKPTATILAILNRYRSIPSRSERTQTTEPYLSAATTDESPVAMGAATAAEYLRSVWVAEKIREGGGRRVTLEIEDWCPTDGQPFTSPPWWCPMNEPNPSREWRIAFHAGFAGHLAAAVPQLRGSALEEPAVAALDRSLGVLEQAGQVRPPLLEAEFK